MPLTQLLTPHLLHPAIPELLQQLILLASARAKLTACFLAFFARRFRPPSFVGCMVQAGRPTAITRLLVLPFATLAAKLVRRITAVNDEAIVVVVGITHNLHIALLATAHNILLLLAFAQVRRSLLKHGWVLGVRALFAAHKTLVTDRIAVPVVINVGRGAAYLALVLLLLVGTHIASATRTPRLLALAPADVLFAVNPARSRASLELEVVLVGRHIALAALALTDNLLDWRRRRRSTGWHDSGPVGLGRRKSESGSHSVVGSHYFISCCYCCLLLVLSFNCLPI